MSKLGILAIFASVLVAVLFGNIRKELPGNDSRVVRLSYANASLLRKVSPIASCATNLIDWAIYEYHTAGKEIAGGPVPLGSDAALETFGNHSFINQWITEQSLAFQYDVEVRRTKEGRKYLAEVSPGICKSLKAHRVPIAKIPPPPSTPKGKPPTFSGVDPKGLGCVVARFKAPRTSATQLLHRPRKMETHRGRAADRRPYRVQFQLKRMPLPRTFHPAQVPHGRVRPKVSPDGYLVGDVNEVDNGNPEITPPNAAVENGGPEPTTSNDAWVSQDPNNPTWYLFIVNVNGVHYGTLVQSVGDNWSVASEVEPSGWACSGGLAIPPSVVTDFGLPVCSGANR